MTTLVPSSTVLGILNRTLDLTTGTYYAHLVTVVPTRSVTNVASLTVATGGNYASQPVTLSAFAANGTGVILPSTSPSWTSLTTNGTAIVGCAICKQAAASPAASDTVVSFLQFNVTSIITLSTTVGSPIVTAASGLSAFATTNLIADNTSGTVIPIGTRILLVQSDTSMILSADSLSTNTSLSVTGYTYSTYTPKTSNGDDFVFTIPSTGVLRID